MAPSGHAHLRSHFRTGSVDSLSTSGFAPPGSGSGANFSIVNGGGANMKIVNGSDASSTNASMNQSGYHEQHIMARAMLEGGETLRDIRQRRQEECKINEGIAEQQWNKSTASERKFWDNWIANRGGQYADDFASRMNGTKRFLEESLLMDTASEGQIHFKVLDVGAGPVSFWGYTLSRGELELVPIDPLATLYDSLWAEHALVPPCRTRLCAAENITRHFADESFDMVVSRNALDHAINPFCDLFQMFHVLKPGHTMLIMLFENEGEFQNYSGMHQWNFQLLNGSLMVRSKRRTKQHDVGKELQGIASTSCTREGRLIRCTFTKRAY